MPSQPETNNDTVLYKENNIHADKSITVRMLDDATFDIWGGVFVNGNPVSGGGTFPIASQPEAEAGVDNTKVMTPLRVSQAIDAQVTATNTPFTPTGSVAATNVQAAIAEVAAEAVGISDGDKGDIVVSASGTAWAIDNDVVTNAKLADMVNSRIKGRITSGTGDPEDLTPTNAKVVLGLNNVDNTTDLNKPVSTATQTALDLKADKTGGTFSGDVSVPDEAYGVGWNNSLEVPTKNAVYDKIETIAGGSVTSVNGETGVVVLNQDEVLDGSTYKQYSQTEKTKLSGISAGATQNSADGALRDRTTHTGEQAISTITNLQTTLDGKASLVSGGVFASDISVPNEAYSSGWNGSVEVPTKNALYDKIETIVGGGGIAGITVSEAGTPLDTDITTLDFGAGFDLTESPENEVNIVVDLSEYSGSALPVTGGGTGLDTLTSDRFLIGAGVSAVDTTKVVPTGTVVGTSDTQTLSNKTIALGANTITGTLAQFDTAVTDANLYASGSTDVTVQDGGTGRSTSTTAYGIIAAGTTATGVHQTISPGTSGHFLKSAGASTLASFAAIAQSDVTSLTTDLGLKVDKSQTINAQTGTTYTLVLTDDSKLVTLSNASAIALTVPTNASVAFPVGTRIDLVQKGAGQVTVGGTPTVNSTPTKKSRAQYSGMTLVKEATDTWYLFGDLAAT